jgi:hypothetical protein
MRFRFSPTRALGALLLSAAPLMSAGLIELQSGTNQTALLELYTSEGCSSCPPAEAWLSRIKESPKLWKDFVPVAFHVDYWDYLGWKDPFAVKAYSDRQRAYADHWRSRSVYTPGFILDGKEWRGWFTRDELPRASIKPVGVLTARSEDGKQWTLRFQPVAGSDSSSFDFHAALLGIDVTSDVKAGENRGRKLEHDFVVLATASTATTRNGEAYQGALLLNPPSRIPSKRLALAVWVTPSKGLQPLQAVGGWLSSTNR